MITTLFVLSQIKSKYLKIENFLKVRSTEHLSGTDSYAIVIVEPRKHPNLQYVIENFDVNMDPKWDLYVFHGKNSSQYVIDSTKNVKGRKKFLYQLEIDNLTSEEYNFMFKQKEFWDLVDAENIIVFQTDSVLCGSSPKKIEDFLDYGYIGCSAGKDINIWKGKWSGAPFYGIGGLSFRKKSFMTKCIKDGKVDQFFPEDVFYSVCVEDSKNKPTSDVIGDFCTQYSYDHKSFGAHKITDLQEKDRKNFLEYCSEASKIDF